MTSALSPRELAGLFAHIGEGLNVISNGDTVFSKLCEMAVQRVDGSEYAGITIGREGSRFETVGATDDVVLQTDQIQYDLRSGPCVDAVVEQTTFNAGDLRFDQRWPEFGRRTVEATGIVSMLSMRLFIEDDHRVIAGLNSYSHQPNAFGENSEAVSHLLATHGGIAVGRAAAQDKVRNLTRALDTSRQIGTAIGIVMAMEKVTNAQAFDLLRIASQQSHHKIADIALEVIETGALPDPPPFVGQRPKAE